MFKGTTAECCAHLAQTLTSTSRDDSLGRRKSIASFVGVSDQTVRRWLNETIHPVGEPLIRFRFCLELMGYEVVELQSLNPSVRTVAAMCAFRVTSLRDIADFVGYKGERGGSVTDQLLAVLRGSGGVSKEKLERFTHLVTLHEAALKEKVASAPRFSLPTKPRAKGAVTNLQIADVPHTKQSRDREAIVESLAGSVQALIPLVRLVSSDGFTAKERARVRELSGGDGVFTLANLLYRLCGERARKIHSS
jgi:hypothetical protein